jgi:hypothetical protein
LAIVFDEIEGVVQPGPARSAPVLAPPGSNGNQGAEQTERTLRELRARQRRQARTRAD